MPTKNSFQFTDQDAEIVHYVHQLRLATLDHLVALTNRSYKTLERRVAKLRKEKYLRRLRPRPAKGLYVLGRKAVPILIEQGYAPEELRGRRRREIEWKDLTIPHALLVATIHTKLLLASKESPIKIAHWQHDGPDLWDSVHVPGEEELPVRPDAYFILQYTDRSTPKGRLHFFLEADVGTMSHKRIESKIKAYAAYHQQQKHVAKFGINHFQVAIVTKTSARAAELRTEFHPAMSAAQRRAYHFIPLDELNIEELLGSTLPTP